MINKLALLQAASEDVVLSHAAVRVLALIVTKHWNDERQDCFAGDASLAAALGIKARAVRDHLAQLEQAGYIRRSFSKAQRLRFIDLMPQTVGGLKLAENLPATAGKAPSTAGKAPPYLAGNLPAAAAENLPHNLGKEPRKVEGHARADRKRPKRPIPDDWAPAPEAIAFGEQKAREAGITANMAGVVEKFRNLAVAKDWRYVDWSAAFRNFVDNEIGYAIRDGRQHIGGGVPLAAGRAFAGSDPNEAWRAKVASYRQSGTWDQGLDGRPPDHQACRVPIAVLREFGYQQGSAAA